MLESIRGAYEAVKQLAEPDLDLDNLSNEEMAYADAAVVKYITERFGEQDGAIGNWPRDWHECPEAFDLWKSKIREIHARKAMADLEKATVIAEVEQRDKAKKSERKLSRPLFMKSWAKIFGISTSTMRRMRNGKKYDFIQKSERKWSLPIDELPAEYLEKYRAHIGYGEPDLTRITLYRVVSRHILPFYCSRSYRGYFQRSGNRIAALSAILTVMNARINDGYCEWKNEK